MGSQLRGVEDSPTLRVGDIPSVATDQLPETAEFTGTALHEGSNTYVDMYRTEEGRLLKAATGIAALEIRLS